MDGLRPGAVGVRGGLRVWPGRGGCDLKRDQGRRRNREREEKRAQTTEGALSSIKIDIFLTGRFACGARPFEGNTNRLHLKPPCLGLGAWPC